MAYWPMYADSEADIQGVKDGLMLEISALKLFTVLNRVDEPNCSNAPLSPPPPHQLMQYHSFFRNFPLLFISLSVS